MKLSLLLRCADLEETRRFYGSTLGFRVTDSADNTLTVALHEANQPDEPVERDEAILVFTADDLWRKPVSLSGTIHLATDDVNDCFDRISPVVHVEWPVQEMPYGAREFGIRDCNGYVLAFQQRRRAS